MSRLVDVDFQFGSVGQLIPFCLHTQLITADTEMRVKLIDVPYLCKAIELRQRGLGQLAGLFSGAGRGVCRLSYL